MAKKPENKHTRHSEHSEESSHIYPLHGFFAMLRMTVLGIFAQYSFGFISCKGLN